MESEITFVLLSVSFSGYIIRDNVALLNPLCNLRPGHRGVYQNYLIKPSVLYLLFV